MKTLLVICTTLLLGASSCARCYECTTSRGDTTTYCKGDPMYDAIKRGVIVTNYNGEELTCKAKM